MLITGKREMELLMRGNFRWLGIPGIERTKKGRLFAAFYTGDRTENFGNYVPLYVSDDEGATWRGPVAIADFGDRARAYDECLWIDPMGRLWFFYGRQPEHAVFASVCDNPDGDELVWSEEKFIGRDVMMNKPIVTRDGRWLLPIAVWADHINAGESALKREAEDRLAYVYESRDNGETFTRLGGVDMPQRCFDEHMVYEKENGDLRMLVRTFYGIGESTSHDGGLTWEPGKDSGLGGPNSRFYIGRLQSGHLLLINHVNFTGRSHLTALISRDDGNTWEGGLLLDERSDVSYPDAVQAEDGKIYAIYDRERYAAREVLMAVFTEEEALAGTGGDLKKLVMKIPEGVKL